MTKNFKLGELVWAKMKGFPYWPGKIYEPEKGPLTKKHHHYVLFFGPENHAWIPDTNIRPHDQSFIDDYENKKTMPGLRHAINEIAEYAKLMPSTSQELPDDQENDSSVDDERSKPGPSKYASKARKDYFGTKNIRFKLNSEKKFSKAKKRKASEYTDSEEISIPAPKKKRRGKRLKANKDKDSSNSELISATPPVTKKKVGFLGLGLIGANIMRKAVLSGHSVIMWDLNKDKLIESKFVEGVEVADSPKDLAEKCDIIFSCVVDEIALITTIGPKDPSSAIHALDKTKGYVEMTSVGEEKAKTIAQEIKKTGAQFLEAPVSSSTVDLAEEGKLKIFASGCRELFDSCASVFHAIADYKQYIGEEIGQANAFSVIGNSLCGAITTSLAENLAFAHEMHLSRVDVLSGLNILGHGSDMVNEVGLNIVKGCSSLYSIKKQQRDMHLTLNMAEEAEQSMVVTAAANQVLVGAKNKEFILKYDDSTVDLDNPDSTEQLDDHDSIVKLNDPLAVYLLNTLTSDEPKNGEKSNESSADNLVTNQ